MTRLIENNPNDIEFYILDLKRGLEFGPYERLKQVKKVVANPEDAALLPDKMLKQIQNEYDMFRANNWSNVVDTPIKKRKFIIVDEAAQLAPEKWMDKEIKALLSFCQAKLCEIARLRVLWVIGFSIARSIQQPILCHGKSSRMLMQSCLLGFLQALPVK
nr:FtsK/SpoIIIE domain-containing protein [Bacillus sp. FJAT-27231]